MAICIIHMMFIPKHVARVSILCQNIERVHFDDDTAEEIIKEDGNSIKDWTLLATVNMVDTVGDDKRLADDIFHITNCGEDHPLVDLLNFSVGQVWKDKNETKRGHTSLSVGDIVKIERADQNPTFWLCCSLGWSQVLGE